MYCICCFKQRRNEYIIIKDYGSGDCSSYVESPIENCINEYMEAHYPKNTLEGNKSYSNV